MWQYNYDYLSHGINGFKYIDKFKNAVGKWVYVYKEKAKDAISKAPNRITSALNKVVNKFENTYDRLTKNNIFSTSKWNYDKKVNLVKKTKEWQNIVNSKNPEYVKKDKNGNVTYDIDSYIMKKKHPVLDIIDDVVNGRDLSINDISLDSIIAGADDYMQAGIAYVGTRAKVLSEVFKYKQGSYKDEEQDLSTTIKNGMTLVNKLSKAYEENEDALNQILDDYSSSTQNSQKVKRYANTILNYAKNNGVDVDEILDSEKIEAYLKENGISKEQIKKYV